MAATGPTHPSSGGTGDGAAAGACLEGDVTCYETGGEGTPSPPDGDEPDDTPGADEFDVDAAVQAADGLLGRSEDDLPADVRIARRGDEEFALTEDYVLGRLTVELDDTDGSGFRVVVATVELPDGPRTVELTPG